MANSNDPIGDLISQGAMHAMEAATIKNSLQKHVPPVNSTAEPVTPVEAAAAAKANIAQTQPQPPLDMQREAQAELAHKHVLDLVKVQIAVANHRASTPSSTTYAEANVILQSKKPEELKALIDEAAKEGTFSPATAANLKKLTPAEIINGSTLTPVQLQTFNTIVAQYNSNDKDALHTSLYDLSGTDGAAVTQKLAMWAANHDSLKPNDRAFETVMRYAPQAGTVKFITPPYTGIIPEHPDEVDAYKMRGRPLLENEDRSIEITSAPEVYIKELRAKIDAERAKDPQLNQANKKLSQSQGK